MLSAVLTVLVGLPPVALAIRSAPADAAPADRSAAVANVEWLHGQLDEGRYANPLAAGPDYGLMEDAVLAMYAAGRPDLADGIVSILDDQSYVQDYITMSSWQPRPDANRLGGPLAKSAVVSLVTGRDIRSFGGMDLLAELRAAIISDGPEAGRVTDHGPLIQINNANTFGQAFAVLAFAGAGDPAPTVIDKLLWQQCQEGYFRIFYSYNRDGTPANCEQGKDRDRSAPDRDSTAIALSALLTARRSGVPGLDEPIDRARRWLIGEQQPAGGWGGGVNTEAPNTNSTGLVVQALASAGGADDAVAAGQDYLGAAQVTAADRDNDLRNEVGAIAYRPEDYRSARQGGIVGVDTWIRAGAQASLGLAAVGFPELVFGEVPPPEPPPTTTTTATAPSTTDVPTSPTTTTVPAGEDRGPDERGGSTPPPVPPATGRGFARPIPARATVVTSEPVLPHRGESTPAQRLADHLAGQLTGGDHIEVELDGERMVDYDATADLAFALRALGEHEQIAARITSFLLGEASIDAYVRGAPYETDDAVYLEPLAKLLVLAAFASDEPDTAAETGRRLERLATEFARHLGDDEPRDLGTYGDRTRSVRRLAWLILGAVASGADVDAHLDTLVDAMCSDGGYPVDLAGAPCSTGDTEATAMALRAMVAVAPPSPAGSSPSPGDTRPVRSSTAIDPQRVAAASAGLAALESAVDAQGIVEVDGRPSIGTTGLVVGTRSFLGRDVGAAPASLAVHQTDDGGFVEPEPAASEAPGARPEESAVTALQTSIAAAEGLAGCSWIDAQGSPITAAAAIRPAELPTASVEGGVSSARTGQATESPSDRTDRVVPAVIALCLLAVGAFVLWRRRTSRALT